MLPISVHDAVISDLDRQQRHLEVADPLHDIKDGAPYKRRKEVDRQIDTYLQLPLAEVARRANEEIERSPDFVHSETVLYFVRQKRADHDQQAFRSLYETLRARIRRLLRKALRVAEAVTVNEMEDRTLFHFDELLALDRRGYELRLDFYECAFNKGLLTLRINALRDVRRQVRVELVPLEFDGEGEPFPEVEQAFARWAGQTPADDREREYRIRLLEVIRGLPDDEKRVIEMHDFRGIPMDSPVAGATSVASTLGVYEQTVRKRRKRALAAIAKALREGD